jgi:hypothetical protein
LDGNVGNVGARVGVGIGRKHRKHRNMGWNFGMEFKVKIRYMTVSPP